MDNIIKHLFKLELSFQIEGTLKEEASQINARVYAAAGRAATGRAALVSPDPKVSAMADDCTLLVTLTYNNLRTILDYLKYFERISGLGCNVEKTMLMPVGVLEPVPQDIVDLGVKIVSEITLLGAVIKNTGLCFESNSEKIIEKVRHQVNFWNRFNLSLPGRINVAKTFMYSQINYLGCIIPLGTQCLNLFSNVVEKFVKGKLQIGKQKIYDKVENGGLGLFEVKTFLASQCCAWVRRSVNLDEFWKREFFCASYGQVFNIRKGNICKMRNPLLYHISECFERFIFCFTARDENFAKSCIFENPSLPFDGNNPNYLTSQFFTEAELILYREDIQHLSVEHLLNPDYGVKTKLEFENISNIRITEIKFNRLQGLVNTAVDKYRKIDNNLKKKDTVKNFCMRIKRGSKKYRKIISGSVPEIISTNISRFSDIIDQVIDLEHSVRLNSQWRWNFLDNSTRTFIFKLHNNLLGINTRVAHFVRNHERTCTFCMLRQDPEDSPETLLHLFFNCQHTENIVLPFYSWLLSDNNRIVSPREFLQGFDTNCTKKNFVLDLVNIVVKKYVWDCKLRFSIPNLHDLKSNFMDTYTNFYKMSSKVRHFTNNSGTFTGHAQIRF